MDQQRRLLEQIGTKLRVDGAARADAVSVAHTADSLSYYDNITMYSALETPVPETPAKRRFSLL